MRASLCLIAAACMLLFAATGHAAEDASARSPIPAVVADLDGVPVTGDEARETVLTYLAAPTLERRVANKFLQRTIFRREAARLGCSVTDAAIRDQLAAWAEEAGGVASLRTRFDQMGLDWYGLRSLAEDHLLIAAIVRTRNGLAGDVVPSPAELQEVAAALADAYAPQFHGLRHGVVGTVGGTDLTAADLDAFLVTCLAPAFWRNRMEQLVSWRRILRAAEDRGIALGPLDLQRAEARLRRQVARDASRIDAPLRMSLKGLLRSQGLTAESLRQTLLFRAQAALLKLIAPSLTDDALAALYDAERESFRIVRARHILFAFDPDAPYARPSPDDALKAGARRRLEAFLAELDSHPLPRPMPVERFAELARTWSDCAQTRARGGDLLYLIRDPGLSELVSPTDYNLDHGTDSAGRPVSPIAAPSPALAEAVFALEDGTVSAPVESPYGFHVLRRDGSRLPDNWRAVRDALYELQIRLRSTALVRELADTYPVAFHWEPWADH